MGHIKPNGLWEPDNGDSYDLTELAQRNYDLGYSAGIRAGRELMRCKCWVTPCELHGVPAHEHLWYESGDVTMACRQEGCKAVLG